MKDTLDPDSGRDDIDVLVDALLSRPDRASDIKALLRNKMFSPEVVRIAQPVEPVDRREETSDAEDLWDNVPI